MASMINQHKDMAMGKKMKGGSVKANKPVKTMKEGIKVQTGTVKKVSPVAKSGKKGMMAGKK